MQFVMVMYKNFSIVLVLSLIVIGKANAQNGKAVHLIPEDDFSPTVYFNVMYNTYYDTKRDQIYFHSRDSLYRWDMSSNLWTFVRRAELPEWQMIIDIDSYNDRLLVWSAGGGHVYETDVEWKGDLVRIDKSINHRNQFEHGYVIAPPNGRLMLFGGYGFWQDKDIMTYFDGVKGEWDIQVWKGSHWPSRRVAPMLNYWEKQDKIVLVGGRATTEPEKPYVTYRKTIYDIWTFDITEQNWTQEGEIVVDQEKLNYNELMLGYMVNQRNGLLQDEDLIIGLDHFHSNDHNAIMFAVDLRSMQGSFLDVPTGALSKYNRLLGYFLKESTRQLIFLWAPALEDNRMSPLFVSTINIPPADSIRANISKMVELAENGWEVNDPESSAPITIPIAIAAVALPIIFWQYRRRERRFNSMATVTVLDTISDPTYDTVQLKMHQDGFSVVHKGADISDNFSSDELDLLFLLAKQYQNHNKFISTEQIEQALWDPGTNPDYSRKMRNQVQKKLEETLKANLPKTDGSTWLLNRNEPSDKRRKEYALNPEPYKFMIVDED